jgi:hypothetical protein
MGKTGSSKARASANRARGAAENAASNPYLRKLIEDAELRDNIRGAYDSARSAMGRLNNGKAPSKALLDDKKVHKDLRNAAESLRAATDSLRAQQKRKRRWPKLIVLGMVGAGAALVLSEGARKTVLDKLFGAEEEFEYTSTTSPVNGASASAETPAKSAS